MGLNAPWTKFYGDAPSKIEYPDITLCDAVWSIAEENPNITALVYMDRKVTYKELKTEILLAQQMLADAGVKKGDKIMVCLPNIPQAVYLLYGADRLGAVSAFIHPLSAREEIIRYIAELDPACVIALDSMYSLFEEIKDSVVFRSLIFTSPADELSLYRRMAYELLSKTKHNIDSKKYYLWRNLKSKCTDNITEKSQISPDDTSVVLFSGGTTGEPKGVMLSGKALNAMAVQTAYMSGTDIKGKIMLSAMPVFHGFGLCVCVHTVLCHGGVCVLVPRFTTAEYTKLIRKYRPHFIAGVPTLFEALIREKNMKSADLSCLQGVFCGGDSLPVSLKKRFDAFLKDRKSTVKIREGYGATECVTASCLTPKDFEKEGSIGVPFPDTYYKICEAGTENELPNNSVGEICISGPAVMKGYLNDEEETKRVLKRHSDGRVWLHTGDAGSMDEDGFVYFSHRLKRVIISSGYNIYPQVVERALELHPKVQRCCVVGVKDEYKMERVKAYVVPCEKAEDEDLMREELIVHLKRYVARFALPSNIEFMESLPVNAVGKIEYSKLEKKL